MIYLDYAATAPMTQAAQQAYLQASALIGNPSSVHLAGQAAREKLEEGRDKVAQGLATNPRQLIANSGGTEGNNHVLLGVAAQWEAQHGSVGHLVTTQTEHAAVLAPARLLMARGWDVTFLTPQSNGLYKPEQLQEVLRPDTALVSIHHLNNELGVIQPTAALAHVAAESGVAYHTDAVQAAGILKLRPEEWGVTYLTLSAHKWGGPRGVGFLWSKRGAELTSWNLGGGQEGGMRAGTQNTAGVYAAGIAFEEAYSVLDHTAAHLREIKTTFLATLREIGLDFQQNEPADASDKITSLYFPQTDGEALLMNLDLHGVCASAGSACSAGTVQVSHVLQAIGLSVAQVRSTLRFSFGKETTISEVKEAAAALVSAVECSRIVN